MVDGYLAQTQFCDGGQGIYFINQEAILKKLLRPEKRRTTGTATTQEVMQKPNISNSIKKLKKKTRKKIRPLKKFERWFKKSGTELIQ